MITEVIHRKTHERLTVELEIGGTWWLRNSRGEIEKAPREHFASEQWRFVGSDILNEAFSFTQIVGEISSFSDQRKGM